VQELDPALKLGEHFLENMQLAGTDAIPDDRYTAVAATASALADRHLGATCALLKVTQSFLLVLAQAETARRAADLPNNTQQAMTLQLEVWPMLCTKQASLNKVLIANKPLLDLRADVQCARLDGVVTYTLLADSVGSECGRDMETETRFSDRPTAGVHSVLVDAQRQPSVLHRDHARPPSQH